MIIKTIALACLPLILSTFSVSLFAAGESEDKSDTTVVMLGTGTPAVDRNRAGQGILIVVDKSLYLFDAGPGALRNIDALRGEDFMPLVSSFQFEGETAYQKLDKIFLTHLDSDHVLGLPELLLRPWVLGRNQPVEVVGPEGTQFLVNNLLEAYEEDINHRLHGSEPANPDGYKAKVSEISHNQLVYQDDKIAIRAFRVPHGSWSDGMSFGYRVETPDKVVVLSGDTRMEKANYPHFKGADILIHEVISEATISRMPELLQKYMLEAHTSTEQLAEIAKAVKPGLLILNHVIAANANEVQSAMDARYDGPFTIANDLDIYR